MSSPQATRRPFLGWRAVGAAFAAQLLSTAATFAPFGVFVVPLSEAFETTPGRLLFGFTGAFIVMGVMGPFVGRWLDRGLTRTLMITGTLATGGGLLLLSLAQELWQLAVVFCGVIAVGTALFGPGPSAALVANWFVRRRGLALGIAVAGATMASFIAPPLAAFLIDELGWRGALAGFAGGIVVLGLPVFAAFAVARPELVGQSPDGDAPEPAPDGAAPAAPVGLETRALVRDPRLWVLSVGFGLVFTSPIVIMASLVPFGEDLGFSRQKASFFFSVAAPFSLLGKVVFGALSDRIPARTAIWLVVTGNALVWGLLHTEPSYAEFLLIAALYGLAIGATGPLHGVVLGLCFGRANFGRANGIGGLASLPLVAGAPAMAGILHDATGSYYAVFSVEMAAMLLGGVLLSLVQIPRTEAGVAVPSPAA